MAGFLVTQVLSFATFVQAQGNAGFLYYALGYFVYAMCALPVTIIEVLSGFLFGAVPGFCLVMVVKTVQCTICFQIGRFFMLKRVEAWIEGMKPNSPTLQKLDVQLTNNPFMAALMFRLGPVPLAVKNYGLAAFPQVTPFIFTAATFVVNVPFTMMWCVAGGSATSLVDAIAAAEGGGGESGDAASSGNFKFIVMAVVAGVAVLAAWMYLRKGGSSKEEAAPSEGSGSVSSKGASSVTKTAASKSGRAQSPKPAKATTTSCPKADIADAGGGKKQTDPAAVKKES